jgi:hypothetical protein
MEVAEDESVVRSQSIHFQTSILSTAAFHFSRLFVSTDQNEKRNSNSNVKMILNCNCFWRRFSVLNAARRQEERDFWSAI